MLDECLTASPPTGSARGKRARHLKRCTDACGNGACIVDWRRWGEESV